MNDLWRRRLKAEIAPVSIKAAVVRESRRVSAATDVVVGLIKISEAGYQIALVVSLEARSRHRVEDSVSSIAIIRIIAAALDFEIIDVLRIELRSHIACDVRVWNGHAVQQPAHLVAAADVKLVVGDVRAGDVIRDDGETIGPAGARSVLNILTIQQRGRSDRIHCCGDRLTVHNCFLRDLGYFQLKMQHGACAGRDDHSLI